MKNQNTPPKKNEKHVKNERKKNSRKNAFRYSHK